MIFRKGQPSSLAPPNPHFGSDCDYCILPSQTPAQGPLFCDPQLVPGPPSAGLEHNNTTTEGTETSSMWLHLAAVKFFSGILIIFIRPDLVVTVIGRGLFSWIV